MPNLESFRCQDVDSGNPRFKYTGSPDIHTAAQRFFYVFFFRVLYRLFNPDSYCIGIEKQAPFFGLSVRVRNTSPVHTKRLEGKFADAGT